MKALLFAVVVVAQVAAAESEPVGFDLCYLDMNASPQEFRPDPRGRTLILRVEDILSFRDASVGRAGIDCVKLAYRDRTNFVVGTPAEICKMLGIDPGTRGCEPLKERE